MPEAESGRGWTDDPYTEAMRDALVQKVGEQQRRVAAAAGTGLGGRLDRGQHQKMLLGAVGRLRVFDQVPARCGSARSRRRSRFQSRAASPMGSRARSPTRLPTCAGSR
jgi:hypothetical protein